MEVKNIRIRTFHVQQGNYGHQLHVERYGVQLNVEKVFMLTVRLQLEITATDPPQKSPGTHSIPPVDFSRKSANGSPKEKYLHIFRGCCKCD
jgi:hypothetical protein